MKSINEINQIESCICDTICPNCIEKHCLKPVELTGNQIADIVTKPKYYKVEIKGVPIDVIDIANAYNLSFMKGNAIKCLQREIEYEAGK